MKSLRAIVHVTLIVVVIGILSVILYGFVGIVPVRPKITWGVDFSQMQSEQLGLNWKENFQDLLGDLGTKHIKLHTQWDFVEGENNDFYFKDIDWQLAKAEQYQADIIYVVGMKTGRWPECHLPNWAENLSKEEQQQELLSYIAEVVQRYKHRSVVAYWQVENEPLFNFGICPWYDSEFLKKEVALVKSLDPTREVIISDSGEQSLWMKAASIGDVVGVTLYRKVWMDLGDDRGFYIDSFLPAVHYYRKALLINLLFHKPVIGIELQAEPWTPKPFYDVSLEEQQKTMNPAQFKKNVQYAKDTGFDTFYFWGAEWWYWLKTKHQNPEIWNEAKALFVN